MVDDRRTQDDVGKQHSTGGLSTKFILFIEFSSRTGEAPGVVLSSGENARDVIRGKLLILFI